MLQLLRRFDRRILLLSLLVLRKEGARSWRASVFAPFFVFVFVVVVVFVVVAFFVVVVFVFRSFCFWASARIFAFLHKRTEKGA